MEKQNYKIQKTDRKVIKLELNDRGEYIALNADDSTLFERFVAGYKRIYELSEEVPQKLEEIEKKYEGQEDIKATMEKTVETVQINSEYSRIATDVVDDIFGEDTVKKYFRELFDEIPSFRPDIECIVELLENITPVMEEIFGAKMEERKKQSRAKIAKYQPQDHKKSTKQES
jgi:hypothetical protein